MKRLLRVTHGDVVFARGTYILVFFKFRQQLGAVLVGPRLLIRTQVGRRENETRILPPGDWQMTVRALGSPTGCRMAGASVSAADHNAVEEGMRDTAPLVVAF